MIPTVIIPLINNERLEHYESLAHRAVASIEAQTITTPYIVSYGDTHSEAKNDGVDKASAEACMILDADDVLDSHFMEAVDRVDEWDIIKPRVYVNGFLQVYVDRDIRKMNHLINGCPFKTELWQDVGGAEEVPYPDWYLWAKIVLKHDPDIVYVRDAIYHYIQSADGLNRTRKPEHMEALYSAIEQYEESLSA